jgi:hypothetical protein
MALGLRTDFRGPTRHYSGADSTQLKYGVIAIVLNKKDRWQGLLPSTALGYPAQWAIGGSGPYHFNHAQIYQLT